MRPNPLLKLALLPLLLVAAAAAYAETCTLTLPGSGATPPAPKPPLPLPSLPPVPTTCGGGSDPCTGSPTVGTICSDGSVYVGLSPDGNVPMFATRCDAGQTWNGSACTGTRSNLTWNNGTTTWYDIPTIANCVEGGGTGGTKCTSYYAGETYSAAIAAVIAGGSGGPHNAAQYCENLTENGQTDWYLPSAPEMYVLYSAKSATNIAGTFDNLSNWYWSSTEIADYGAWRQRFSDGYQSGTNKEYGFLVRCVRR